MAYLASYGLWFGLQVALGSESPISPVTGNSMIDEYYEGDMVIVQGVRDKDQIAIGDVITFHEPGNWGHVIIHRVINREYADDQLYFLTKGDNNQYPDPGHIWPISATPYRGWLPADHIVGRVIFRVPFLGWPLLKMQGYLGKAVIVLLIIIIFVLSLRRTGEKEGEKPETQNTKMFYISLDDLPPPKSRFHSEASGLNEKQQNPITPRTLSNGEIVLP